MGDETYQIDHDHPIPDLGVIDVNTVKNGGGSDLFIVIADPLSGDRRSLERLLRKVEVYLEFIKTDQFRRESGVPTPKNTSIIVKINRDSDRLAFDLLERNKPWVKNNGATLVVDTDLK
ncbi:hypothetical protein QFW77_02695 [Luteimonas sp. RD2P54]|uniref:Uncharacterized protein n=1 Tax=Luteimonas endophytica TaxID=3042023 RepID=A0ABT6J6T5_9GAMM|nr:hypothetical protein [Luteimonas endophytica]MDH5821903.1 hypothetical protein [Luteimonas endophytica]